MKHAYLTKKDIDVARIIGQITKEESNSLMQILKRYASVEKGGNIVVHKDS